MEDEDNEFNTIGRSFINLSGLKMVIKLAGIFSFPKLMKYLNVTLIDYKTITYFRDIVRSNMAYRKKNGIVRNDMINILLDLKKGSLTDESTNEKDIDGDIGFATVHETKSVNKISGNEVQSKEHELYFIKF